jgi:hypothetical protein
MGKLASMKLELATALDEKLHQLAELNSTTIDEILLKALTFYEIALRRRKSTINGSVSWTPTSSCLPRPLASRKCSRGKTRKRMRSRGARRFSFSTRS